MADLIYLESTDILLTPTTEDDLDTIVPMSIHSDNHPFVLEVPRERHLAFLADPDAAHLTVRARADNRIVGYGLLFGLTSPHESLEFRHLVIHEKGRGYGRQVMRLAKVLAFERLKFHRLWLDVMTTNDRAYQLYL